MTEARTSNVRLNTGLGLVPGVIRSTEFEDSSELTDCLPNRDFELLQTAPSQGPSRLSILTLPGTSLRFFKPGASFVCRSRVPLGDLAVAVPLPAPPGHTWVNGRKLGPDDMVIFGGGSDQVIRSDAQQESAFFRFPEARLAEAYHAHAGAVLPSLANSCSLCSPSHALAAQYKSLLAEVGASSIQKPESLALPARLEEIEHTLFSRLVALLAHSDMGQPWRRLERSRLKVVANTLNYFGKHQRETVYLAELCRAIGVSERTVQQAFQSTCGFWPMRYLRLRRLHHARRILRQARIRGSTVKQAALEAGLTDLGRFAMEYRCLFGELPSETLARKS